MKLRKSNPLLLSAKMLLLTFTFSAVAISCSDDDDDNSPAPQQTVLEIAAANADFDVLAAAAERAGTDVLNVLDGTTQITVFAPTDAAFIAHLDVANEAAAIAAINGLTPAAVADLLTFHVIAGSEIKSNAIVSGPVTTARATNNKAFVTKSGATVTINNARVTTADVDASNGVIHIIDAVLTPPAGNIVSIATTGTTAEQFNLLTAALTKASLVTPLQGNGPFTVFAPNDVAFLALLRTLSGNAALNEQGGIDVINEITATSDPLNLDELTAVLQYHVVPNASAFSINLTNNQVLQTLKGTAPNQLTVGLGSSVTVDGAASDPSTVVLANVAATNGVIHVIDRVLLPQ